MASLKAFGGNNILNMTIQEYYQKYPSKFKGSGTFGNYKYSYSIDSAPLVALGSTGKTPTHNMVMTLSKVTVAVNVMNSPIPAFNKNVPLKVFGVLGISKSVFSATSLTATIQNASGIEKIIAVVINSQIMPKIEAALSGITLPQLNKIFGTDISAKIISGTVVTGPAFEIGAQISNSSSSGSADTPSSTNLNSLNNGSAANAIIIGTVHEDATNYLIEKMIESPSYSFNESVSKWGFSAGIKGTIKASVPEISISNSSGKASTRVSISSFKAGVKAPLAPWVWVSISVPSVDIVVNQSLSSASNKGIITLTGVSSLKVELNWPSALNSVESLVEGLFNSILSLFKGKINKAISGQKFTIFSLPSSIPGTGFSASLSFASNGLSYYKNSVQAIVKIKTN